MLLGGVLKEVKNSKNGFTWSDGYTINGKYDATEEGAYTLNWNDEFEGNTIDRNKWGDYKNNSSSTIAASSLGGNCYWTDLFGESPYNGGNLKNLIYQSDGKLVLGAQKVTDKDFVQSRISTYYTMSFRYGLMEICGKLAPDPAFSGYWLNGGAVNDAEYVKRFGKEQERSGMTEIDILENFSSSTSFSSNVHRWWDEYDVNGNKNATGGHTSLDGDSRYTGNSKNNKKFSYDISKHGDTLPDDFHIYSFYWDDNKMKFAFDGKTYFTYSFGENSSVSVHCLMNYLIMECGMGAATYGAAYKNDLHGNYYEHQIDYVRIYQHNAVNSQLITAWPEKQSNGTAKCYYSDNGVNGAY